MPTSAAGLLTRERATQTQASAGRPIRSGAQATSRPRAIARRPASSARGERSRPQDLRADVLADLLVVRRTLAGDHEAFTALVEKYRDPVYSVAYRMMGNPTEAEDVAQDAFVRAYTQLHAYNQSHRFSTWLLSITSHLAIDQIRRRRFVALPLEKVPFLEWITDGAPNPEFATLDRESSDEIQRILDKLPSKYRVVLLLRYWYDLSYEEIAERLRMSPALVKARLHRARVLVERTLRMRGIVLAALDAPSSEQLLVAGDRCSRDRRPSGVQALLS